MPSDHKPQPGIQDRLINFELPDQPATTPGKASQPAKAARPSSVSAASGSTDGIGYTSQQVIQLAGITYRQLDHWDKIDFIRPSAKQSKGSGSRRLYSYQDLLRFRVAKRLLNSGASFQAVSKIFNFIEQLGDSIHAADLIVDENQVHYARNDEEILDLLKQGQGVLNFVSVTAIREELDGKLVELAVAAETTATPAKDAATGNQQRAVGA